MSARSDASKSLRPDVVDGQTIYLIKNVSFLRATHQIRMLLFIAAQRDMRLVIMGPPTMELSPDLRNLVRRHEQHLEIRRDL